MLAVKNALIWKDVFGDEAEARLSNVIGTQAVNPWVTERIMEAEIWREVDPENFVEPAEVFDALAVTTYFGGSTLKGDLRQELLGAIKAPDIDATLFLFEKLQDPNYAQSIPDIAKSLAAQAEVSKHYGLELVAYEGGQHVHHAAQGLSGDDLTTLNEFMIEFVRSPEMAELYRLSWESWAEVSDGAYMQFGDMTKPSKSSRVELAKK